MEDGTDPVERLSEDYPHRDLEDLESDLEASGVLENYLEHEGVDSYSKLGSDYPLQAVIGRNSGAEVEAAFNLHYTFPADGENVSENMCAALKGSDAAEMIERCLPDRFIGVESVELQETREACTPSGGRMFVDSLHCMVFYDEPVLTSRLVDSERLEGGFIHRRTLEEALEKDSLGTAIVTTGRTPESEYLSGVQVDYWTRFFDGVDGGLDYTDLDWSNPLRKKGSEKNTG